jgi:Fe-S cluster assembly protein SufD
MEHCLALVDRPFDPLFMVAMREKTTVKDTEAHLQKFERFEKEAKHPAWVFPLRKAGISKFAELGFPTLNDEDWRFTSLAPIKRLAFNPVFSVTNSQITADFVAGLPFQSLPGTRLVFVDGHFAAALSSPAPEGIEAGSLGAALANDSALLEKHLGRYAQEEDNAFTSLNMAFFQDGAYIHVPSRKVVENPVHIIYVATGKETGATANPRNLILAGQGSQITILESYVSAGDAAHFTNVVTEIVAEENSVVEHCKFQNENQEACHMAAIHVRMAKNCHVSCHSIAIGARLSRNNIRTSLAGEGVNCILNGLYITRGEQLADHHMVVEHAQPHCNSHEYYNGILDDRSKGVFHGRILVRQAAQKTDAKQTNKNLLLSENATADTKPQLEIYADDVKCTHGATIGQLNEEAIFYLQARGIGMETARRMLIHAFAGEIIERIRYLPIREEMDQLIWDRLEASPLVAGKP